MTQIEAAVVGLHSRVALSINVSISSSSSKVVRLIAFSTSAVAVCWSNASRVSLNRRVLWIAITASSANVPRTRTRFYAESPLNGRPTQSAPIPRPSNSIGTKDLRPGADGATSFTRSRWHVCGFDVGIHHQLAIPGWRSPMRYRGSAVAEQILQSREAGPLADDVQHSVVGEVTHTVSPANRRWQLCRMTSNTGLVSAIELLIAASTLYARC